MKKKILFVAIVMLLISMAFSVNAKTYGSLTYEISNGEVTITDCSTSVTSVDIPSTINGYPVTSIGNSAFYNCTGLTSVTIPDSVTSIGDDAFYNCTGITQINWNAKSVENFSCYNYIFAYAGQKGEGIKVVFGDSVERIPAYAFYPYSQSSFAPKIVSVTIGDNITSIGSYAFYNCTGLTSVTIPDSVTSIGSYAFYNCTGLTSVTIGNSVTSIGYYAFYKCTGLTSVTIPDSVTGIGSYAFYNCTGITQINWNAKSVEDFSYDNYIFAYAGQKGEGIKVVFGDSVERIPAYAFYPYSQSSYAPKIVSVTIGDNVTSIGASAFYYCKGLTSVTIPDSVTSIGSSAFYNCTGLTSVTIPDSVTSIGNSAFYYCKGLTSVTIPDSVTSIGSSAFYNCTGLTSVTIGDSVTSIGDRAFYNCTGLTQINWNAKNVADFSSDNYVFYCAGQSGEGINVIFGDNVERIPAYVFYPYSDSSYAPKIVSVTIGDSVTSIGSSAFSGCTGLTSVTIPDSVTSIGSTAFYYCKGLTSVTIGDSVTSIGSTAFKDCTGLTSVTIGDSVTSIGSYAFYNCTGLTSVTIGDGVTSIGFHAFYNCTGLTSVYITDLANWCQISFGNISANPLYYAENLYINNVLATDITIPDSVTSIGDYAFRGCTGLTSITIPDSVTSIGNSAFEDCTGLTSITIPDGVTSIDSYAFKNCSKLRRISFGSGLQTVGVDAFDGCTSLTKVNIPTINDWCEISFGDREGNPVYYTNDLYVNNILLESDITFPEGITTIGSYTFYDIPYLGDCILPNSLKKIGTCAFGNTISKIDDVYFQGSEDDWYAISIGTGNDALIDAKLYTDYYPDDPQIKYAINSVKVKDVVGNSLNNIPNTAFIAEIKVTNVASYTNNYILIATYDSDGRMLDIDFLYANPKVGQTVTFGTQIKNENGNVAKIKAFVISDLKSFSAVAEAVELVKV